MDITLFIAVCAHRLDKRVMNQDVSDKVLNDEGFSLGLGGVGNRYESMG
jgi:hypothetical protein